MRNRRQYRGFSLTEVLLAVGTLAVGMIFISGTFLTGIHFSTISTERTIAAVVADEAFAKIRIYRSTYPNKKLLGLSTLACVDVNDIWIDFNDNDKWDEDDIRLIPDPNEFAYPSTSTLREKQYYWSALCRVVNERNDPDDPSRLVQVTVFISRKIGASTQYRNPADPFNLADTDPYPRLVNVGVSGALGSNVLTIQDPSNQTFINGGYTIVENRTGQIFRVLARDVDLPNTIRLDRPLPGEPVNEPWVRLVWVIPPPVSGGRYPCIGVYQKVIRF